MDYEKDNQNEFEFVFHRIENKQNDKKLILSIAIVFLVKIAFIYATVYMGNNIPTISLDEHINNESQISSVNNKDNFQD